MAINNKQRILQTARELFYHQGYLATSVDDILQQANISKSNFYYHFKSKEDLGIAVLDLRKEDFQAVVDRTLRNNELVPAERLVAFFRFLIDSHEAHAQGGCPFGNLVAEMAEHSDRFRCQLSAMFGGLTMLIAELLVEGQQRCVFRSDVDATDLAALIVQTIQGMHLMTKCHKTVETYERSTRILIRLIEVDRTA